MQPGYINKLGMNSGFQGGALHGEITSFSSASSSLGGAGAGSNGISGAGSFKDVMMNSLGKVNDVVSKPDHLMTEAMTGGNVDVHDVMIANAKAELAVNVTAQFTTKVVQAYDRILQIQV